MSVQNFVRGAADFGAVIFGYAAAPALRFVARRDSLPRFRLVSDRLGFAVRSTHYYDPTYREADLPAATDVDRALPGLDLNVEAQLALLARFTFADELRQLPRGSVPVGQFSHDNEMYSYGDAETLYSMIRLKKPKRLFEIGSGHSTLVARLALAANRREDPAYTCRHLCIEPFEVPWLEATGVEVLRERVEKTDLTLFDALEANDILFIDSSHVIRPWGDVLFEFQQIVPRLRPGVLIHVHDVFTPRDYPEKWLRTWRRLWNEQYLVESFLAFNSAFEIMLATNHLSRNAVEAFGRASPAWAEEGRPMPAAFWFRRVH